MYRFDIYNANFTTIYIHDEAQKDLDWAYFVDFNGDGNSGSDYNKKRVLFLQRLEM